MGKFDQVLLTVDYDRTLTAPDSTIPQRNLEAIRYFMEEGGLFTVNTGRSVPMAAAFMDLVPVNAPLLLYNGSGAYDVRQRKLIWSRQIQRDLWQTIGYCKETFPDLMVEVQGLDAHYRFWENPKWDEFYAHNHCAAEFAPWGKDLGPFLKFTLYLWPESREVSGLFQATPEEMARMDQVQQQVTAQLADTCQVFRSGARILDIHAKGVSKARSARLLKEQTGREILVCLGDADNDIAMLEEADFAFVPADAVLADRFPNLCPCGEGAVADAIYGKIPEILENTP